jgi:hypothetical protein
MESNPCSALIAYVGRNEGLLWQAILKLQGIDAVFKPLLDNIHEYLMINSPNILLMSINANSNNVLISGGVCRWCQSKLRNTKVFLVNPHKPEISDLERRWATRRGAIDVLPQLTTQNATQSIREVLTAVGKSPKEEVIPILMNLIEKYNPTPSISSEDSIHEKTAEENTSGEPQSQEITNPNPNGNKDDEYIIYRGIKVPRFSIASNRTAKLIYRGLPIKQSENN